MKSNTPQSRTGRIAAVLLSILFLWGFGLFLLVVILNIGLGFPDNDADFRQSFLGKMQMDEYNYVTNYLQMQQSAAPKQKNPGVDVYGIRLNLHTYEQHFDPENTNYRFAATDSDGNLLLTNDPDYGSDLPLLASSVFEDEVYLEQRDYQVQRHFDDPVNAYQEITYGNVSQYLEEPSDYKLWYFSDTRVDNAYHNNLDVKTFEDPFTDYMFFEDAAEANKFDYQKVYGALCTWKIVAASADNLPPAMTAVQENEDAPVPAIVVEIQAYSTQNEFQTTLESYYNMKAGGIHVIAVDEALEKLLNDGLDITIRGEHAVTKTCYIRSYLYEDMPVEDSIRANYAIYSMLFRYSEGSVVLMFVLLVLTVISCIAMCTAAGRTDDSESITDSPVHRIAYECFWILPPALVLASLAVLYALAKIGSPYRMLAAFCAGMVLCIAACSILWLYTTAIRAKIGTFWSSFGLFRIFRALFSMLRNRTFTCILFVAYSIFLFFINCIFPHMSRGFVLLILAVDLLTLLFILYCVYAYFELHRHVTQMETGDFTPAQHPVPLAGDFGGFDSALNGITGKVADIVAQQTKAEHLRTELITNVSHDLKTPLTSIVNYVDLLSREPMQSDAAREYLEVLRRQAARLKKLTIDLVDASKASAGTLNVELIPMNLQVLLSQLAGEYEEQMEAKQLSLILSQPEEPLMILADGRQIWRVFDNLLNNACKYALAGTRVYLDVKAQEEQVRISLKNVSAQPLNISPDELMERFVRGDASRHTEGSGLGLSIARDLTVLQNGTMRLSTDGDLFKAYLTFPIYHPPQPEAEDDPAETPDVKK